MSHYPDPQQVVDDLGDKFLKAFVKSIDMARSDLAEFEDFKQSGSSTSRSSS